MKLSWWNFKVVYEHGNKFKDCFTTSVDRRATFKMYALCLIGVGFPGLELIWLICLICSMSRRPRATSSNWSPIDDFQTKSRQTVAKKCTLSSDWIFTACETQKRRRARVENLNLNSEKKNSFISVDRFEGWENNAGKSARGFSPPEQTRCKHRFINCVYWWTE